MPTLSVADISKVVLTCMRCGEPTEYDLRAETKAHKCRNPQCPVSREAPQLPESGPENMCLQRLKWALRTAIDAPNQPNFAFKEIRLKFKER